MEQYKKQTMPKTTGKNPVTFIAKMNLLRSVLLSGN